MGVTERKYSYKIGGSLPFSHPTYVERKADKELLKALKAGKFCYVFNCRQMGKSSLRVRAMHQLQAEGMHCVSLDITSLGSDLSLPQWYGGIITQLFLGLNLAGKVNLKAWLKEREELPPVQKLRHFLEEIILNYCPKNVYIFIDEIDKVISLDFSLDDFFSLIRFCYNQRAENLEYQRLTFALFGVATPSDLIQDKTQTPFNIGQAIELAGLTVEESQPLAAGLGEISDQTQSLLTAIVKWTGGQPFLTQKLCQILLEKTPLISPSKEAETVAKTVQREIVENWEFQDEPVHLKTIRDRLLRNEQRAGRLLGLYQQILDLGEIEADNSPEQGELRLSGLVVKREGKLQLYNPIYSEVFNSDWVKQQLEKLRPYSEAIAAWQASDHQDESRLLRGQSLKDALGWAMGKSLSNLDYQFLSASQNLDKREAELNLETQRQVNQILSAAHRRAKRTIAVGFAILLASLAGAGLTFQKQQEAQMGGRLQRMGTSALQQFQFEQLDALIAALQAAGDLQSLVRDRRLLQDYPATSPLLSLQQILDQIQEKNRLEGHQEAVTSASFSPDGQVLATASRDGTVKLWDRRGRELATLKGHQGAVYGVSFSPDGQGLASASQDRTVKLWDRQGRELLTLKGHESSVYSVSFSPDGQFLASTSRDRTARLWDLKGRQLTVLRGHQKSVDDVAFSPDGQQIGTASRDGSVRLWNRQGQLLQTWQYQSVPFYSLSFSPDGQLVAAAARDGTVKISDRKGNLRLTLEGHQQLVNSVNFSRDGQRLASASSDGTVRLWDRQGRQLATLKGHEEPVYDAAFSPDGRQLASASSDGTAKLWDLSQKPGQGFKTSDRRLTSAAVSADGEAIAAADEEGNLSLWERQGQRQKQFSSDSGWLYAIAFSPDGQRLATAARSGAIALWDRQGRKLGELGDSASPAYSLSFSADGGRLAAGTRDGIAYLWNLTGDRPRQEKPLKAGEDAIEGLSFSPDGKWLAAASRDGMVRLWDRGGKLRVQFLAGEVGIEAVSFSPDAQVLATAARDGMVKLWDLQGQELGQLSGDRFPVYRLAFTPDGRRLAAASSDGTVRLWDLQGNLRAEEKVHGDAIYAIGFTRGGQQAIAVARDGRVRIWQVTEGLANLEQLLQQGCDWLQDYLTTHPREGKKLPHCT